MDTNLGAVECLAAWLCDPESQAILAANPAARRLLGYDEGELQGLPLSRLLAPDQPESLLPRAFPEMDDPVLAGRWRLRRKDGSESLMDIASGPSLHEGRRVRILFALDTRSDGLERERLLADLFRRAQQQMVLVSLAREAASPDPSLRALMGRMIRAAALALDASRLSVWLRTGGRTLRKVVSTEDVDQERSRPDARTNTTARLEIPLPLDGPWHGVLRCSRSDGAHGWTVEERRFLEAVACLSALAVERHSRPGSVRELREALQSALAGTVSDVLGDVDLRRAGRAADPATQEREVIRDALRTTGGNRTEAAKLLGMSRVTLWKRLKRMGS
ncbi:MAG: PAS domain-containing protein [Planctomycetes bacterium]|nr:PAS domain-containing protein [Planctomycetota bacterium]